MERVFSRGLCETEPLFELQPTCTPGMQCLLLPWKSEKVRAPNSPPPLSCVCVCAFPLQVSLRSAGYTAHNIDVSLYKVANQIAVLCSVFLHLRSHAGPSLRPPGRHPPAIHLHHLHPNTSSSPHSLAVK